MTRILIPWAPNYIAEVTASFQNRRTELTIEIVDILKVIQKAAPDIPTLDAYRLARYYQLSADATDDLDLLLAFAPWRSNDAREQFGNALKEQGWLRVREPGDSGPLPVDWGVTVMKEGTAIAERGYAWGLLRHIEWGLADEAKAKDGKEAEDD